MPDFGNIEERERALDDLLSYGGVFKNGGYVRKRNEQRYIYADDKEKGISPGLAINKKHVRINLVIKEQNFHRSEQIFQMLQYAIPNEPGVANWEMFPRSKRRHTLVYKRHLKGDEDWRTLRRWLIDNLEKLEAFRRDFC